MSAYVNVDRRCGLPVAIVAASIGAFLTTGCVSLDAPPGAAGVFDLQPPSHTENVSLYASSGEVTFPAFLKAGDTETSDARQTVFQTSGPLVANQAWAVSDDGVWQFVPNELFVATPIYVAIDFDPVGLDPHLWMSQTDLRLEFEPVTDDFAIPTMGLTEAQRIPVDVQAALAIPLGTLVSPVMSSRKLIARQDVWQSVMKATAVGFLVVVLLVPWSCSFVAGVVCGQPRAGPRGRRRTRRRPSSRFLANVSRAIANVPSH